jgi:protein TonB
MTPRILVPDDINFTQTMTAQEKLKDIPARRGPTLVRESNESRFAPPNKLFAEAMLENSSTKPPRRLADFVVSATVQVLLLTALLLVPLFFTEAFDIHQFNKTLLVAPPTAPAPPPLPSLARSAAPKPRTLSLAGKLVAPRVIPKQVARLNEGSTDDDLVAPIIPGEGVPGGVSGGLPGGMIGGALSGAAPPPATPINSAPKGPIRVDGHIKAPRLIFGPAPVYPVLAQRSRISGAVVIDAVIDTQGNVVEMRTVSGHPFLALSAMEALRRWKYEPTILGGEPVSVQLLVTLTFDNRRS